jgi:peptidoglycan/xylan/chitin deacetylase (PgdA/CDA1 family)
MDIIPILQKNQEIWDLFTRKEEYNSQIYDKYDRFPYYASANRTIFEPRVSRYLLDHGYHMEYPDGKKFAVCLTHDIDVLYKTEVSKGVSALWALRKAHFAKCVHSLAEMQSKKMPWWNFSETMALEEKYGAKSSFYFKVQNPGDRDHTYDIKDCESVIGEILDKGWEVGLHGGHTAYNHPVEIKEMRQKLEKISIKSVVGYRNHFLRFRIPDTWEHLSSAGFRYDSTLGYADCIGFRNGMCHPFKPYNLTLQHEIDIVEIPLMIMDQTLDCYMRLDPGKAWEMTKQLIDTVADCHGVITLLWHNTYLIGEQREFYEKILKYCSEKNAWMTSGEEIANLVKDNS